MSGTCDREFPQAMLIPSTASPLRNNVLSLFTLQVASLAAPLVSIPYLVRALEPANYGRIAVAQALVHYLVLLTDYGFNLSATRQVAASSHDPRLLSDLLSAVLLAKTMLLLVAFVLLTCVVAYVPLFERDWPLYLGTFMFALGSLVLPVWLLQGLERMRVLVGCQLAAQAASLCAIFALVHEPSDYRLAAMIQASAPVLAGCMCLLVIRCGTTLRLRWPGLAAARKVLVDGWHVFLSTMAVSMYTNTTMLVVSYFTNPTSAGHFAAADKLVKAVQGLLTPVSQAAYPHIARLSAISRDAALLVIARLLRLQGAATLAVAVLLFTGSAPLVNMLFGEAFAPAKELVRWMAFVPFVVGLSNVFGVQTMLNFDMKQSFSNILLVSGVVNLGLLVPLTFLLGTKGAAISVLTTETVVAIAMSFALYRRGLMAKMLRPAVS